MGAKGVFKRQNNDVIVPKYDPRTITSEPVEHRICVIRSEIPHCGGTMENSDDAPRLLVQDGRFVKIFCAVLSSTFKTILPFKSPFRRLFDTVFQYLRGAKRDLITG